MTKVQHTYIGKHTCKNISHYADKEYTVGYTIILDGVRYSQYIVADIFTDTLYSSLRKLVTKKKELLNNYNNNRMGGYNKITGVSVYWNPYVSILA